MKSAHEIYNIPKEKHAYELYLANKPFVKVYSVVQKGDKFLVLKNDPEKARYKYSLAGGGVEANEDIPTATLREISEELNVNVKFVRELDVVHYFKTWHYQGKSFDVEYEAHIVLSQYLSDTNKHKVGLKGEFEYDVSVAEISKQEMLDTVAEFTKFGVKF